MRPSTSTLATPLFVMQGRVESRRVLRPAADGPRMEISFSAAIDSASLGTGGGAFTFIAQPLADGRYRWRGRGVLLLAQGSVSAHSEGWGRRADGSIAYRGALRLSPHNAALDALARRTLVFDYTQDLQTLAVRFVASDASSTPTDPPSSKDELRC